MAKVRVPKEHRPPTRFGIIVGKSGMEAGRRFRVAGVYRSPRVGETFWGKIGDVITEFWKDCRGPRVILEEVKD